MFCPLCHAEYRDGFMQCSDCHVALVGVLEETESSSTLLWNPTCRALIQYLRNRVPFAQMRARANTIPLLAFCLASVAFAGASFLTSWYADDFRREVSMLTPAIKAIPFSVAWSICVFWAYKVRGRRALWLLLGFPFAWYYAILLTLFVVGHMLTGGGV
jgi:hypothetical protein